MKATPLEDAIIRYLATNPDKIIIEIQKSVNNPFHSAVSRSMINLKKSGIVNQTGTRHVVHGPAVHTWSLSEKGKQYLLFLESR